MKRQTLLLAALLALVMVVPSWAAPLFPDVPENHWARDAVASLAARGLVEGYPDGTFKGDRASTRWEVAMIMARFLAKMEEEHATFASKADLAEVRKLVNALREELDALGVRVTNLEEGVARLDSRVSELERITFYGMVETRVVAQSFRNTGMNTSDNGIGQFNSSDYNTLVGTYGGTQLSPYQNAFGVAPPMTNVGVLGQFSGPAGVLPVIDMRNGRALTNGTGFTMRGILGLRIRVSDDVDAGAEFAAFTSQGDSIVDAVWGVSAPYLSNPYTANRGGGGLGLAGAQPLTNSPFTRVTLDNFWVIHNPSNTKLVLGAFSTDRMDDLVYVGQYNPNANGPEYLPSFGFNISGASDISDTGVLRWEVLGTQLADGNISNFNFSNYQSYALGLNVGFEFEGGDVKANFLRAANEASGSNPLAVGLIDNVNVAFGAGQLGVSTTGGTPLQWVNPSGYFAAQTSAFAQLNGGVGSTVDNRPIAGWNPAADNAAGLLFAGGGGFGPQGMTSYGLSGHYMWDLEGYQIYVDGEFAHSDYKPNQNSAYSVGGDAYRFEVGSNLLDGSLDLSLAWLSVDPTYDPFILQYPTTPSLGLGAYPGVWRLPDMNYFANMYSLHDTKRYPHNREGLRFDGQYHFDDRHGRVYAFAEFLDQKKTSLYDVRVPGVAGVPNFPVLGMSPGFIDPVFFGYAHPSVYGASSSSSFTDTLQPMEDPRGTVTSWGLGYTYKFTDPRLKLDVAVERHDFYRPTSLSTRFGGGQNLVDLQTTMGHFQLGWEIDDRWNLRGGVDLSNIRGHWDPAGLYNAYSRNPNFDTVNSTQIAPFVGFDCDVSTNTAWSMDFTYYDTNDNMPTGIYGGRRTNNDQAPGANFTNHPFDWQGWQLTSSFSVKF